MSRKRIEDIWEKRLVYKLVEKSTQEGEIIELRKEKQSLLSPDVIYVTVEMGAPHWFIRKAYRHMAVFPYPDNGLKVVFRFYGCRFEVTIIQKQQEGDQEND